MCAFTRPNSLTRRELLAGTAAAALAAVGRPAKAVEAPPNIVYLLIDDMGFTDVGFQGGQFATPHMDALAASGAVLDQHYVQPLCSPTRAALLTGRYPMRYGLQVGVVRPWAKYGLPLSERLLPQALGALGYQTAICGKWHLGHCQPEYLPTRRGFDHQYGHYNGAIDCFTHERDGGFDWHRDDKVCRDEGYSTDLIADDAIAWLRARDKKRPFFLYLPFNAVHAPLQAPREWLDKAADLRPRDRAYGAMLMALDAAIGRIVAALTAEGLLDKTLIVLTSDNGGPRPGSNGTLRGAKGSVYEGGTRVAACMSWPGRVKAGSRLNQPVHLTDWYPTLIGLAGGKVDQPLPIDGRDQRACLFDGAASAREEMLLNAAPAGGALRLGDWKLVVGNPRDNEEGGAPERRNGAELFNLAQDPGEKTDLAAREPERLATLRRRYDELARQAVPSRQAPAAPDYKAPAVWGE